MKKIIYLSLIISCAISKASADEGMWLPMLIERLNYVDMQKMGLHLTADELYSINHASLKDAIVGLAYEQNPTNFFCSAEMISQEGLVITNHHCGFESIQSHSSTSNDYLKNGFWALSKQEEMKNEGIVAAFLVRIENVTERIMKQLPDTLSEDSRNTKIESISEELKKENNEDGKYEVSVKSFFNGNEFYLFVYQVYKDVRLVGAPPSSIGKFGGETDNWMWPRHTGDFSMLRIYKATDGSSAAFSKTNIPLKTKRFLPISLKGLKKDDFVMVWGYPGETERFLTSYGVSIKTEEENPSVVKIRDIKLSLIAEASHADPIVKIQYASKYAEIANYWKFFIGETQGLKRLKVWEQKKNLEEKFQKWVDEDETRKAKYGNALQLLEEGYAVQKAVAKPIKYYEEALFGPDIIMMAYFSLDLLNNLASEKKSKNQLPLNAINALKEKARKHFKDYNATLDKQLFIACYKMFKEDIGGDFQPEIYKTIEKKYKNNIERFAEKAYAQSIFADSTRFYKFLEKPDAKTLTKDIIFQTMYSVLYNYQTISMSVSTYENKIEKGKRLYLAGLMEMNKDAKFYPDANSTMRVSYGKVEDYFPKDAVHYDCNTTLDGVMEKENPDNEEFIVPSKLKELYRDKDYGQYGENGVMKVCFLTNNDITGGNSGSPVINGDGQLTGLAFDGNWEAMDCNVTYEAKLQRTICVDIRYILFVIDKYAGATNLVNEMTLIH